MAEADEKITTARWRAIEKTLPCSADKADFRNKLEQIKRNKTPPKELAVQCEEAARQLDEHPSAADALRNRAANYRKISRAGGFPLLRKFSILWLWDAADGNLGVSTPRKRLPYAGGGRICL